MAPEDLREAISLSDELFSGASDRRILAAGHLLKGTALRDLGRIEDAVAELERSISLAPDWISNRQLLAAVYKDRGEHAAAAALLRRALESAATQPAPTDNQVNRLFESLVTGRVGSDIEESLQNQLREVSSPPPKTPRR